MSYDNNNADKQLRNSIYNVVITHKGLVIWVEPISFEAICFDSKEKEFERDETEGDQMCSIILGSRTYGPNHLKISSFNNITDLETENEVDLSGPLLNRFHKVTIKDEQEEVRGNLMFVTYRYYQTLIKHTLHHVDFRFSEDNREKVKPEESGKEVEYIVSPITTTQRPIHPCQGLGRVIC